MSGYIGVNGNIPKKIKRGWIKVPENREINEYLVTSDTEFNPYEYRKTTDTEFIDGKTYYKVVDHQYVQATEQVMDPSINYFEQDRVYKNYYELIDDNYVLTEDVSMDPSKTYYECNPIYVNSNYVNKKIINVYKGNANGIAENILVSKFWPEEPNSELNNIVNRRVFGKGMYNNKLHFITELGKQYTFDGTNLEYIGDCPVGIGIDANSNLHTSMIEHNSKLYYFPSEIRSYPHVERYTSSSSYEYTYYQIMPVFYFDGTNWHTMNILVNTYKYTVSGGSSNYSNKLEEDDFNGVSCNLFVVNNKLFLFVTGVLHTHTSSSDSYYSNNLIINIDSSNLTFKNVSYKSGSSTLTLSYYEPKKISYSESIRKLSSPTTTSGYTYYPYSYTNFLYLEPLVINGECHILNMYDSKKQSYDSSVSGRIRTTTERVIYDSKYVYNSSTNEFSKTNKSKKLLLSSILGDYGDRHYLLNILKYDNKYYLLFDQQMYDLEFDADGYIYKYTLKDSYYFTEYRVLTHQQKNSIMWMYNDLRPVSALGNIYIFPAYLDDSLEFIIADGRYIAKQNIEGYFS